MSGFNEHFLEKLRKKCYCLICLLPMKNPVKITACGHRFCDVCLQQFLRMQVEPWQDWDHCSSCMSGGVFKCPEDDKPLDYAKIYPDPEIHTEVMNSHVRCKYYKEGCRWVDKLQNLQGHVDVCRYDTIPCPNQCLELLSRLSLDDHLEFSCTKRIVICEFCNQEFPGDSYDMHAGNCQYEVVWCENKCGARLERRFLNNHMRSECHKRTVKCPYCSKEFVHETLQTHQYQCPRYPVPCPNRCDPTKIPREEVDVHVQELCPSATISCSFKHAGCTHKCPRYSLDRHNEDNSQLHLQLMCDVVQHQQDQITQLCNALYSVTQVTNGTFIWKITDYKQKLIESMYKNTEIVSEPFYTTRFGYKMAASVFLNGNGSGEGKYLSIYIKLLQGEYDNILDWPFMLPISFTLYDQNNDTDKRANITESFAPDPTWKHFQKPIKDVDQLGFGYPKFVSHEVLKTKDYVRGDSLIVKVKIDNSQHFVP